MSPNRDAIAPAKAFGHPLGCVGKEPVGDFLYSTNGFESFVCFVMP